jgi:hypothetical protein
MISSAKFSPPHDRHPPVASLGADIRPASRRPAALAGRIAMLCFAATPQMVAAVSLCCGDDPRNIACKSKSTLRQAIGLAADGGTVDLSTLPVSCSTITLASGQIAIAQTALTIDGPSDRTVTVDAHAASRVFVHVGTGSLVIHNLALANGSNAAGPGFSGGCIYSNGSIAMSGATIANCVAYGRGGGIYAKGSVTLSTSSISANAALGSYAVGGAIAAHGVSLFQNSVVTGNHSDGSNGGIYSYGTGRAYDSQINGNSATTSRYGDGYVECTFGAKGPLTLARTAVDANTGGAAVCATGLVRLFSSSVSGNDGTAIGAATISLYDSTISGNGFYGITTGGSKVLVYNSTIANNAHGGILASGCSLTSISSIFFGNGFASTSDDIYAISCTQKNSAYNIVGKSNIVLPLAVVGNPRLTPLAHRGGATRTHGLSINSPAIDAGSNPQALALDQRYTGFARVVGLRADVGAYERQPDDDELFYGGFD